MTRADVMAQDRIRMWLGVTGLTGLTDRQLLQLFVTGGEPGESAFATLVARHGPMVLCTCRAILHDWHDAEDALQATFLVLARQANRVWIRESIAPWLHQVGTRVAIRLHKASVRRTQYERGAVREPAETHQSAVESGELAIIIHAEVDRLPERFRGPVILCDLQGRTHEEAAAQLGYPIGTVKSRLSRARERLRIRLERRGIVPAISGCSLILAGQSATALSSAAIQDTLRITAHRASPGTLPVTIVNLAEGVIATMKRTTIAMRTAVMAMATTTTVGVMALAMDRPMSLPGPKVPPLVTPVSMRAPAPPENVPKELQPFQGIWKVDLCDSATREFGLTPEEAQKGRWTVKGDTIHWKRDREEWTITLRVDPTKKPMEIDLTYQSGPFSGERCQGMFEWGGIDGKSLMISIQDPGAKVPRPKAIEMFGKTSLIFLRRADMASPKK